MAKNISKPEDLSVTFVTAEDDDSLFYSSIYGCYMHKSAFPVVNDTEPTNSTYCYYGTGVVVTLSVFLVFSMVLALVGNTMVILTIARHRGMRTRTNLLLANLAVADILVAVLDIPIALVTVISGDWIFSHKFCDFNGFTVGLGLMLSVHTLMWISIHKFISITRPFSRSVTPAKIILMILAAWTWTIFFNLTPTSLIGLTDTEYKVGASQCGPSAPRSLKQYVHAGLNTSANLVIPFIVMTYCYYRIFKEVKDHLLRMKDFADVSACSSLIEQKQITVTLCIVLSIFVLFWMPYIIYSLSLVFLGKAYVPVIFNPIAYLFGYMNSACNPIIYALRSPSFRRGFSEIIFGNTRRGFSGSLYGRDQNFGKTSTMVVSFKRPVLGTEAHGKDKEQKLLQNSNKVPKVPRTVNMNIFTSAREVEHLVGGSQGQAASHDIYINSYHGTAKDGGEKGIVYKPMTAPAISKIGKDTHKYQNFSESELSEQCGGLQVSTTSALQCEQELCLKEMSEDIAGNPVSSSIAVDSVQYLTVSDNDKRKRHHSYASQQEFMVRKDLKGSASQPDITVLSSQNLNIHIDGSRISKSNRDILVTTLQIQDNQIRSVSVGDVRVTCKSHKLEMHCSSHCVGVQSCENKTCYHLVKKEKPVFWQPSVDNLYDSPVISRRNFHIRRLAFPTKSNLGGNDGNIPRENKSSITSSEGLAHLGVASLITSVKKSFTDLFSLDTNHLDKSGAEILCSQDRHTDHSPVETADILGFDEPGAPEDMAVAPHEKILESQSRDRIFSAAEDKNIENVTEESC